MTQIETMSASEYKQLLAGKPAKKRKFRNKPCELDNIRFDSQAERDHYCKLKLRERAGEIDGLFVHPVYPLRVHGTLIGNYEADFVYRDVATDRTHVEDVKGGFKGKATDTPLSKWKRRMLLAIYGIEVAVIEVRS